MTQIQGIKSFHCEAFNQKYVSTFQNSLTYSQLN